MIHLEDDFFEDPYSVRSAALKSNYIQPDDYSWPGYRSWDVPEYITGYILSKVRDIVGDPSLNFDHSKNGYLNSSFQYITKQFGEGIYHGDDPFYICVIYLSLDAPLDSGTEICDYDHEPATVSRSLVSKLKESFIQDPFNLIKRYRYARVRRKLNSHYIPVMKVPNKFNRGIIYPARNAHRAQNYFGTSIETARLISVSFFG